MTTVTFYKREDGLITGFRAQGHADYAEYGSDIVCAAISSLTQAACMGLKDVVKANVTINTDGGKGLCEAFISDDETPQVLQEAQVLLRTLELSLTAISEQKRYSGYIRITPRERRQKHDFDGSTAVRA